MKQLSIFSILFFLAFSSVSAQTDKEKYKFSADIEAIIQKDSTDWKYQMGATDYSFSEYYKKALETWDKNGEGVKKVSREDSIYFKSFKPMTAKDYIIKRSKNEQIIIINEAHHIPMHRVFTTTLLQGLYNNGYRYFGLEALFDSLINERKFLNSESGYYTNEPQLGNLVYEAIKIGFTIFNYEASEGKNGKEREIEQAQNIAKIIAKHPDSKFLIHCDYEHIIEGTPVNKSWEKAMAGRLKEFTKIDPFTIDQTFYSEKGDAKYNSPYIQLVNLDYPVIMVNNNGKTFNGGIENDQTDCRIIHPITKYINERPDWLTLNGRRRIYKIPNTEITEYPALILAYRKSEFEQKGIPADIVELTDENKTGRLLLDKGDYELIIKNKFYIIKNKYLIKIK
ncbi:MAG: hypothetical protein H6Q14_1746 [Bacteroidetes bacterium]|nr:hypothetical protein [Bacteroidota bacterium]